MEGAPSNFRNFVQPSPIPPEIVPTAYTRTSDDTEIEEMVQIRVDDTCITLPTSLIKNKNVFDEFLKLNPFSHISEQNQQYLKSRLPPNFSDEDIQKLFDTSANFHFGHPLESFRRQISDGWYDAGGYTERQQLRDHIRVWYDHFIRRHYVQLLKTLLESRRKLIEAAANAQDGDELHEEPIIDKHAHRKAMIQKRAHKRCRCILWDMKQSVGESALSSDDEDYANIATKANVPAAGETTVSQANIKDLGLYQPLDLPDVNELMTSFTDLKHFQPDHPSLDFSGLDVEEIIERTGLECIAERVGLMPNRAAKNEAAKKTKNSITKTSTPNHCVPISQ